MSLRLTSLLSSTFVRAAMICISVTPRSRQLARVDILNAARQADLVEICLDHLIKEPNVTELLEGAGKPIIVSCRSKQQGGAWEGTEEERQTLLRQAIVAQPDWIELDLDMAAKIPRFGKTKRLISVTQYDRPLSNLEAFYEQAIAQKADAVKFAGPTLSLEQAWPMLAAVSKRRDIPVVAQGLSRAGITMSLLGAKYGSPWIYAALEKGMELYPGQPTVTELEEIYHWREISPQTRFVAVAGFDRTETATLRIFNAAFMHHKLPLMCLPFLLDSLENFEQMFDKLKISALLPDAKLGGKILSVAKGKPNDDSVKLSQFADLVLNKPDGWQAYNCLWRGALKALEAGLRKTPDEAKPLDRRNVLVIGATPAARTLVYGVKGRHGLVSITAGDDERAQLIAQMFDIRFVPVVNVYDTLCDVVVIADASLEHGRLKQKLNASFLRPNMTVLDVTSFTEETELFREARSRGCKVIEPKDIYFDQLSMQFKALTSQELPRAVFDAVWAELPPTEYEEPEIV
ncbi:MAG: type I 3-dehydroquinate dehydratase [Planctomycetales bacterium]